MNYYLGFDIGASSLKSILARGIKIIKSRTDDLPKNMAGLLKLTKKIKSEWEKDIKQQKIRGMGIAVAGVLDKKRERCLVAPNIKYLSGKSLKKLLQKNLNLKNIKIENDVNCFLLAEKKLGEAKKLKDAVYLTIGSGIGGAFMIDGRIVYGAHGSSGEIGHMIMDIQRGLEFEDLAANKFIKRSLGKGSIEVLALANKGNMKAKRILKELGVNLGIGIANIINIFDPEAVILSGGIADAKKFVILGIKRGIDEFVISPPAKKTKVIFSRLGRHGGALGAAFLFE